MICPIIGLISGMLIGIITEYYTSMNYKPVKELVQGCKHGTGINIILGLALGFMSTLLPTILISITVFVSFRLVGMYGIALAAIGMLGNLPVCLAIDGYGPISDNAGGIATMCKLDDRIREITDDLDSAGNTTAAIGKGFAIGSACLVAFALFGAFVTRTKLDHVDIMTPIIFTGLLVGAMIPYLFSALTMKAVGTAAEEMVQAIRDEFNAHKEANIGKPEDPDYEPDPNKCIRIATNSSLTQMILPGLLVILIPILVGILFGPSCVAGLLIGIIVSGIQMATSSANSGGAWDNTKKSIKKNGIPVNEFEETKYRIRELKYRQNKGKVVSEEEIKILEEKLEEINAKEFEASDRYLKELRNEKMKIYKKAEKASIIGDTVGDPMKDTSGPSLNILIKLSSITSVVFGTFFVNTSLLIK
jgi:inorganic pyrophosphatase